MGKYVSLRSQEDNSIGRSPHFRRGCSGTDDLRARGRKIDRPEQLKGKRIVPEAQTAVIYSRGYLTHQAGCRSPGRVGPGGRNQQAVEKCSLSCPKE